MTHSPPVVYLLHGEDEFAIAQFVADVEAKLGDSPTAAMNIARLDGRSNSFEDVRLAVYAMPFLTSRRVVVIVHPLARITNQAQREKFEELLNQVPPTTALVLIEYRSLAEGHWLLSWARSAENRAYIRAFSLPKGPAMSKWIQDQARLAGGRFTPQAAGLLASFVGDDSRLANQEINKLLAYVNYQRPVEADDVENLIIPVGEGNIFAMVDALGNRDGRQALGMLHRLLSEQDALSIFGMVTRQFRLLLLAREVLDEGGGEGDVARRLKIHPFVAGKVTAQARRFTLSTLEVVYRRLLDLDEAIKTGQSDGDLALDTLIAAFTSQTA